MVLEQIPDKASQNLDYAKGESMAFALVLRRIPDSVIVTRYDNVSCI